MGFGDSGRKYDVFVGILRRFWILLKIGDFCGFGEDF